MSESLYGVGGTSEEGQTRHSEALINAALGVAEEITPGPAWSILLPSELPRYEWLGSQIFQ